MCWKFYIVYVAKISIEGKFLWFSDLILCILISSWNNGLEMKENESIEEIEEMNIIIIFKLS